MRSLYYILLQASVSPPASSNSSPGPARESSYRPSSRVPRVSTNFKFTICYVTYNRLKISSRLYQRKKWSLIGALPTPLRPVLRPEYSAHLNQLREIHKAVHPSLLGWTSDFLIFDGVIFGSVVLASAAFRQSATCVLLWHYRSLTE